MSIAKSLMIVFVATFALTATDARAEERIYRWVDDQGVVHFSNKPVESAEVIKVDSGKVATPHAPTEAKAPTADKSPSAEEEPEEPSIAQQRRDERAKRRQEAAERKSVVDEACAQRRQIVARLEPSTKVMVQGKDGEVYRLDDNERLEMLDEAKSYIAKNCNK